MNDSQLAARCTAHPAYEAAYCPSCGTARPVGMTTEEILAAADEVGPTYALRPASLRARRAAAVVAPDADTVEAAGLDSTMREKSTPGDWTWADVTAAENAAVRIRAAFDDNRADFASDPGGWLAYVGEFDDLSHEIAAAATRVVLSGWGFGA